MNKLSQRLQAIYNLIVPCDTVLEIGCDHCWLSIFLTKHKKVKQAIAADISSNALTSCQNNIKNQNVLNVKTIISDGFQAITNNFDVVVIAGMGTKLICNILDQRKDLLNKQLILQSQTNVGQLRHYLQIHNFTINNEIIVKENDIIYTIISVMPHHQIIKDDVDVYLGPFLKNNKSVLHLTKCRNRLNHLNHFVNYIKQGKKRENIIKEINVLTKFLEE